MSMISKRELLAVVSPCDVLATETDKVRILNEFVAATGYHRKYALTLLNHPPLPRSRPVRRPRAKTYTPAVQQALVRLWEIADRICSKRLVPGLPDLVDALGRHGELTLDASARTLLLSLSPATADRLLAPTRRAALPRGRTTTKPGSLLKHQIPIRTFADWDDARPGFLEIDLVSHGGESASGEYLHSLVLTDIATQWTECVALPNRGEQAVGTAIAHARTLLPVPVLGLDSDIGLDSDNGGEFINHHLVRYCQREEITFTRCRPYKKNDQCHVRGDWRKGKYCTLMVHPLNTGRLRHTSDPIPARQAMPAPSAPHEGVTMRVPIRTCFDDRVLDRLPGQKLPPLQCQRFQDLPPRLDQVQIRRIRRLEDELPARMRQGEEQDIGSFVGRQIIEDCIDPLR